HRPPEQARPAGSLNSLACLLCPAARRGPRHDFPTLQDGCQDLVTHDGEIRADWSPHSLGHIESVDRTIPLSRGVAQDIDRVAEDTGDCLGAVVDDDELGGARGKPIGAHGDLHPSRRSDPALGLGADAGVDRRDNPHERDAHCYKDNRYAPPRRLHWPLPRSGYLPGHTASTDTGPGKPRAIWKKRAK